MNIDLEDIDIERLRDDLRDHFMGAMFVVSPIAMVDLSEVENASDYRLVQIALQNGFDLSQYLTHNYGNPFHR